MHEKSPGCINGLHNYPKSRAEIAWQEELRVWFKPRMALTSWTLILTVWDSPSGIRATPYKVGNIDVRAK